jgi:hypothetical protein
MCKSRKQFHEIAPKTLRIIKVSQTVATRYHGYETCLWSAVRVTALVTVRMQWVGAYFNRAIENPNGFEKWLFMMCEPLGGAWCSVSRRYPERCRNHRSPKAQRRFFDLIWDLIG